ncbi:MAG: hypothetical protein K6F83_08075 [Clostridiales bacterium]|nr:hypothetical protein [Clostridiales bacterium]
MRDYSDIMDKRRPLYPEFPPMPVSDRAAQFSPFAALVGYDDAVKETVRLTDRRREMSEEEITDLNLKLGILKQRQKDLPEVKVTYFVPDLKKEGGSYRIKAGKVRTIDGFNNVIVFSDGEKIRISDTYEIVLS